MTRLFIFLIYWGGICPLGILRKIIGIRSLDYKWMSDQETYWFMRPRSKSADDDWKQQDKD
ncbi:MAG: hypothetical protein HN353_01860 [Bdellovibrionales bacterium]|nr:hypothetical protein [Bdellovibrionales bacterium]MBT3525373.1 hypothetical protein [Bdellovibrionales bacterium]MBT7670460.1 hypothetical protein [Bdellovibrionales bacterium]MBT7766608.1 hypothetical protein [Bdellovibrionales bacterium]